jgi:hypothetical protein
MPTLPAFGGSGATYGRMPGIESSLAALQRGVADKGDVLRVLGVPKGYGMAHLTAASGKQVIWQYELLETRERSFAIKELLVFFAGEKYAGHLWFTSRQEIHEK